MKKERIVLFTAVLLLGASGCGKEAEQLVEATEVIVEPVENVEDLQKDSPVMFSEDEEVPQEASGDEDVFEGSVRSINNNDNFVVISRIFTEELDGGVEATEIIGVSSDEKDLVTVYFTEDTRFRIKTVKNAGEEVTEKEGAFSDIKEESTLEFKGRMDAKGEEFLATDVVIYEFVYS